MITLCNGEGQGTPASPFEHSKPFKTASTIVGYTNWYWSESGENLVSPKRGLKVDDGFIYIHINFATNSLQAWIYRDREWHNIAEEFMANDEYVPHPVYPDRFLERKSTTNNPSWVRRATKTRYIRDRSKRNTPRATSVPLGRQH